MTFLDESVWRGRVFSSGWRRTGGGEAAVTGPATPSEQPHLSLVERTPAGIVHISDQTVDDTPNTPFGGPFASGTGGRFGGSANIDAFTEMRWVTMRSEIAPYPF